MMEKKYVIIVHCLDVIKDMMYKLLKNLFSNFLNISQNYQ